MIRAGLSSPRPRGVGLVYGPDGKPKIKDGWVERLTPDQRTWVEHALAMRGFRLNGHSIEEIDDGYSERRGR